MWNFPLLLLSFLLILLITLALATVTWIHPENSTSLAEDTGKARNQAMKYRLRAAHYNFGGQQKEGPSILLISKWSPTY